jgi:hypothetical protein
MTAPNLMGSIYDGFSPRGQRALGELRAAFQAAGFYAEKERRTERTLRVYPERRAKYPLLNPSLAASQRDAPVPVGGPSILCPVYSDGDRSITHLLLSMETIDGCPYFTRVKHGRRYHLHGYFVLPLSFVGSPRKQVVDFRTVHAPLSNLQLQLSSVGFAR